jgi:putative RecB family exonuclease
LEEQNPRTPWRGEEEKMKTAQDHDHLSYSQINCYTTCSLKYRFHYIDRLEEEFTSSALLFGSGIHAGIQAYLQSILEADPLRPDQLLDVFREEWRTSSNGKIRYSARESEESLVNKAHELFTMFVEKHDPAAEVIAVEEAFTSDLNQLTNDSPSRLPLFTGYVDAIIRNGSTTLIDYKTSSRKPSGDLNAMQLVAYSLGATTLGYEPNELAYRYEYLVKTAKPELISYPVAVGDNERRRFLKTTTRVWKAIQSAIFYPNPSYLCSSCGYQSSCKEW